MKKILFTFIISLFMIPNVNVYAYTRITDPFEHGLTILPQSCSDNLIKVNFSRLTFANDYWEILDETDLLSNSRQYLANDYLIEVDSYTDYYISSTHKNFSIHLFDENLKRHYFQSFGSSSSFKTLKPTKYLLLTVYAVPSHNPSSEIFALFKGSQFLGDGINYEECPVVDEPELEPEPEPEPEPIIPDTTLDNFYSIYVTKLKELSQYAFENKYILGTLAIILLFIILEIILNLFGRRKL